MLSVRSVRSVTYFVLCIPCGIGTNQLTLDHPCRRTVFPQLYQWHQTLRGLPTVEGRTLEDRCGHSRRSRAFAPLPAPSLFRTVWRDTHRIPRSAARLHMMIRKKSSWIYAHSFQFSQTCEKWCGRHLHKCDQSEEWCWR